MKPFIDAIRGIGVLFSTQRNALIHLALLVVVVALGISCKISPLEWCAVALAAGLVLAAEALNTAVEFLADAVHPEQNPLVGKSKDVAAGGVLLAAVAAVAVGVIIFAPRLLEWIFPN